MVVILGTGGADRPTLLFTSICLLLFWWRSEADYYATCEAAAADKSSWLRVPGFELSARVKVIQQDSSKVDEELLVREHYSNVEQRARLEFSSDQQVRRRSNAKGALARQAAQSMTSYLYHGSIAKRLLKITTSTDRSDQQVRDCKLATGQMLADDLFGSAARVDGHLTGAEWLKERDDVPDYLLGFARLLIIADANRARLTQSEGPSVIVRNQEASRYLLKDSLGATGPERLSQIMVYYSKSSGPDDLPLRIWFLVKDDVEIVVDYSMVAQIDYEARATKALEGPNLFAFPLDAGCSQQVPPSKLIRRQTTPKLISFRASVANLLEERAELSYFIGYDGYAEVLRRDTLARPHFRPYSITIHDLRRHLKYNIEERRAKRISGSHSQCSVVYHQSQQDLLQEPVLPLEGMVEMGRASVRGVEVVAFELLTEQLPEIIFPQVSYLDLRGSNRSAYIPNLSHQDRTFCVVYYFTAESAGATGHWLDGRPLGQLLRIDVMQQNHHLYRVEVSDFVWELAEAPNGDRALDLFALGDRCSDDQVRSEHSAMLSMELEFEAAAQKYSTGLTLVSAPEALAMIDKAPKRNLGLADALGRAHEQLGPTQIRAVESDAPQVDELKANNATSFRLLVSARLDLHRKLVYRPRSVAKGRLSKPGAFSSAANFEECLWEVVHRSKQFRYLLFSFCYTTCLVDERPIMVVMDGKPRVRTSNVFELSITDDNAPCEIFSLEASEEQPIEQQQPSTARDIWSKVEQDLNGKRLWLPVWPQKVGQLSLSVKRLDISNDKWSSTNGQAPPEAAPADESVLEGIGLTLDASTIRVDAKQATRSSLEEEELPAPEMSYSLCHSSCVASLGCRSFSLCTSNAGYQLDCLLSELDFRDAHLLQQIQQRRAEVQASRTKRGLVSLQVATSGDEPDDERKLQSVELRVDRRCHLYNKRALELFRPTTVEMVSELRNKGLAAADSEEQCAELCLARNLQFFQLVSKLKSDFQQEVQEAGLVQRRRAEEERNLRSTWCSSFAFIDLQSGKELLPDTVRDTLDPAKLVKRGVCHMPKPPRPVLPTVLPLGGGNGSPANGVSGATGAKKPKVRLTHKYDFIYSSLYEPLHGVRLLALGGNSQTASEWSKLEPEEARKQLSQTNDQAFVGSPDLETCARHCFMQNTPVKPWCRSFGFMSYTVEDQQTGGSRQQYYCVFNSITAADAKRSPLSRYLIVEAPKEASISHYEPSHFLSLENVYLSRQLYAPAESTGGAEQFRLETLGCLVVIAMALISSVAFTLLVGDRFLATLRPRRDSQHHQLPAMSYLNSFVVDGNSRCEDKKLQDDIVLPDLSQRLADA